MSDIVLTSAVRSNLLSLQNTAELLGKTQERLATGLKVNSALDDPTAFFTASSLNSRASDLNRLLDSIGNAVQTLEAADQGLTAITDLLETAQATVRQARQAALGDFATIQGLGASIGADEPASVVGGVDGPTPTLGTIGTVTATGGTAIPADVAATATGDATSLADGDALLSTLANLSAGETLTLDDGEGNSVTVTFQAADDIANNVIGLDGDQDSLVGELNTILTAAGVNITVSDADASTGDGGVTQLVFTASGDSATNFSPLTITGSDADVLGDLGIDAIGAGTTTERTISANPTVAGFAGTLTFETGTGFSIAETIDLTTINTRTELEAALADIEGVNASINGSDFLEISALADGGEFRFTDSGDELGGEFSSTATVFSPAGSALAALSLASAELNITVGSNATLNIDFTTVTTLDDLQTALSGLAGGTASLDLDTGAISIDSTSTADQIEIDGTFNADSTFGLTAGTYYATNSSLETLAASNQTLTVQFGSGDVNTITFGTDPGANEVNTLAELNTQLATLVGTGAGTATTAEVDSEGNLRIIASDAGDSITIAGTAPLGTFGTTAQTTEPGNNSTRSSLESQYNNLLQQVDELARDASFNGNNLINGDNLTVIFNENNTSSLTIQGVTTTVAALGISEAVTDEFQSNTSLDVQLSSLDSAIQELRAQASTFGSNLSTVQIRQDFTAGLINTLETGAANLTLADTNEEGANLLALQTRQQLSSTALSLASQAEQNVLRLFG